MTNDELRVFLIQLIDSLLRHGTDKDGNWGYPFVREEWRMMADELKRRGGDQQP